MTTGREHSSSQSAFHDLRTVFLSEWTDPDPPKGMRTPVIDPSISPEQIAARVRQLFPANPGGRLDQALLAATALVRTVPQLSPEDYFAIDGLFRVLDTDLGAGVRIETMQAVVRYFPVPIWYVPVRRMAQRWMTTAEVSEAIAAGLNQDAPLEEIQNCTDALGAYKQAGRATSGEAVDAAKRLKMQVAAIQGSLAPRLSELKQDLEKRATLFIKTMLR